MELKRAILLLGVLAVPVAAISINYQVQAPTYSPFVFRNFPTQRPYPFQPIFNYAFEAQAPVVSYAPPLIAASSISRMIYDQSSSPSPQNNVLRGFSYQTRFTDGGQSEVIFVTGKESKKLMERNLEFFRSIFVPQNNTRNQSELGDSSSLAHRSNNVGLPQAKAAFNTQPNPGLQLSAMNQFQTFPAHTSPLIGHPFPLHTAISSFVQAVGQAQQRSQDNPRVSQDQYNVEAQESMISEVGTVVAPPHFNSVENETLSQSPVSTSTNEPHGTDSITTNKEETTETSSATNVTSPLSNETEENENHEDTSPDASTTTPDTPSASETQAETTEFSQTEQSDTTSNPEGLDQTTTSETLAESG